MTAWSPSQDHWVDLNKAQHFLTEMKLPRKVKAYIK